MLFSSHVSADLHIVIDGILRFSLLDISFKSNTASRIEAELNKWIHQSIGSRQVGPGLLDLFIPLSLGSYFATEVPMELAESSRNNPMRTPRSGIT